MNALSIDDFVPFFHGINGQPPFPWQVRLARRLADGGAWPTTLELPTGSGKTNALDIAVFHLALESASRKRSRRAPIRIAYVVDRRLIVDSTYDHACAIRKALLTPANESVLRVAEALKALSSDTEVPHREEPLHVSRLRGGAPREGDWTPSPAHPTIVCSTVDQVGSRLLFRGYGVSESMRPLHAGLLGEDALILLDEVHLSEPFRQTLTAIQTFRKAERSPWTFVQLSATPHEAASDAFILDEDDRANPLLRQRLLASKKASLESVKSGANAERAALFAQRAFELSELHERGAARRVLVVVNRVDFARAVHAKLEQMLRDAEGAEALLLIGRAREIDKADTREQILASASAKRKDDDPAKTPSCFFLVATQTVEAGADLDFEALVTQVASLDALRQRFGRLDRLGRSGESRAHILAAESEIARRADPDPVYGEGLRATWAWLRDHAVGDVIDFGIEGLDRTLKDTTAEEYHALLAETKDAPTLLPAYLDMLSRTRPTPNADPSVALFLHGLGPNVGEVQLVWRADIKQPIEAEHAEEIGALLNILPPRTAEAVALPLHAARRWFADSRLTNDVSDVEGGDAGEEQEERTDRFIGWRWSPATLEAEPIRSTQLRPGDVIVLPAVLGGCDRFGWNPRSREMVQDVAGEAQWSYLRRSFAIRLHPELLRQQLVADYVVTGGMADDERERLARRLFEAISEQVGIYGNVRGGGQQIDEELIEPLLAREDLPKSLRQELDAAHRALDRGVVRAAILVPYDAAESDAARGCIIYFPHGLGESQTEGSDELESSTEDDSRGSSGFRRLPLDEHSKDVESFARSFARRAALDDSLADDIALAGWLHDHGKADARFQRYLAGTGFLLLEETLAKSGRPRTRKEDRRAWIAAELPARWRHEALSVTIATQHPEFAKAHDPELVLWLVGTHHGWGRPLFPHADPLDRTSRTVPRVGSGSSTIDLTGAAGPQSPHFAFAVPVEGGVRSIDWCELFERLTRRYGWWGLARLEAIVRLADHRASAYADRREGARRG